MGLAQAVALLVALQRLAELILARRNARRLLAEGGHEVGAGHYPLFVLLHGAWLLTLWFWVPADAPVHWPLLGLFAGLQVGRLWVIHSLGGRWTTRIILIPEAPLIARGPYRFVRHPNYMIVALEIPLLPLAFGVWPLALGFGLANLALLAYRIRLEDKALAPLRQSGG